MKKIILAIFVALIGSSFGEDLTVMLESTSNGKIRALYFFTDDPKRKVPEPSKSTYYTSVSGEKYYLTPNSKRNAAKWPEFKGVSPIPIWIIPKLSELGYQLINGWSEVIPTLSGGGDTYSYYVFKKNP